jgi:hypothetical protein
MSISGLSSISSSAAPTLQKLQQAASSASQPSSSTSASNSSTSFADVLAGIGNLAHPFSLITAPVSVPFTMQSKALSLLSSV